MFLSTSPEGRRKTPPEPTSWAVTRLASQQWSTSSTVAARAAWARIILKEQFRGYRTILAAGRAGTAAKRRICSATELRVSADCGVTIASSLLQSNFLFPVTHSTMSGMN